MRLLLGVPWDQPVAARTAMVVIAARQAAARLAVLQARRPIAAAYALITGTVRRSRGRQLSPLYLS
jgi:hypothetical protein